MLYYLYCLNYCILRSSELKYRTQTCSFEKSFRFVPHRMSCRVMPEAGCWVESAGRRSVGGLRSRSAGRRALGGWHWLRWDPGVTFHSLVSGLLSVCLLVQDWPPCTVDSAYMNRLIMLIRQLLLHWNAHFSHLSAPHCLIWLSKI